MTTELIYFPKNGSHRIVLEKKNHIVTYTKWDDSSVFVLYFGKRSHMLAEASTPLESVQ